MHTPQHIMIVFGTRPEAIKLAPVILEFRRVSELDITLVSTSQHTSMLQDVLDLFEITPDLDLEIMRENQTLDHIVSRTLDGFSDIFRSHRPDLLLVQGDTSTAFAAALAAFHHHIPVGHVEAGLRTGTIRAPFPEEANRRMISLLTDRHFAPTHGNAGNLSCEGVPADKIFITGNTVIDALLYILKHKPLQGYAGQFAGSDQRLILVTAHRRENFGAPIENICRALLVLIDNFPDIVIVYPVHYNPNIRKPVFRLLSGHPRIHLIDPVDYRKMCHLMQAAELIVTDSGGIQEEAPSLGKPVLVMREKTERPEAVTAGTVKIIGTKQEAIVSETMRLLNDRSAYRQMARAVNPYGDGHAAKRILNILVGRNNATE